jgi:hypothetical protein
MIGKIAPYLFGVEKLTLSERNSPKHASHECDQHHFWGFRRTGQEKEGQQVSRSEKEKANIKACLLQRSETK